MANVTKKAVTAALTEQGIEFDSAASIPALQGLLPAGHPLAAATVVEAPKAKVDGELKADWEAFLAGARKVNPERFDRQKAAGEFDEPHQSWLNQRAAQKAKAAEAAAA